MTNPLFGSPPPSVADFLRDVGGRGLDDALVEMIWHHPTGISRARIAKEGSLARSTVSDAVGRILESDLIEECGDAPSRGGRRPTLLRFRDEARWILGADLGATHVTVALTDLRGRVLDLHEGACDVRNDPDAACAMLREFCERAVATRSGGRMPVIGLGVAMPAPVSPIQPTTFPTSILPAWEGHTGLEDVAEALGLPLYVENDANAGALAELWWGRLRDLEHLTFVKLATGIGAGHIVSGQLYRGAAGAAGELGHVSIDPNGPPCICGNRGCVTSFVGTSALLRRTRDRLRDGRASSLSDETLHLDGLIDAALAGDPVAVEVLEEAAEYLGTVLAGLLNLMNPRAIILGGSLTRAGDRLLGPVRRAVKTRTLVDSVSSARIEISDLGTENVALGAATTVLSHALAHPSTSLLQTVEH